MEGEKNIKKKFELLSVLLCSQPFLSPPVRLLFFHVPMQGATTTNKKGENYHWDIKLRVCVANEKLVNM